jgi:hypothetical protein
LSSSSPPPTAAPLRLPRVEALFALFATPQLLHSPEAADSLIRLLDRVLAHWSTGAAASVDNHSWWASELCPKPTVPPSSSSSSPQQQRPAPPVPASSLRSLVAVLASADQCPDRLFRDAAHRVVALTATLPANRRILFAEAARYAFGGFANQNT